MGLKNPHKEPLVRAPGLAGLRAAGPPFCNLRGEFNEEIIKIFLTNNLKVSCRWESSRLERLVFLRHGASS